MKKIWSKSSFKCVNIYLFRRTFLHLPGCWLHPSGLLHSQYSYAPAVVVRRRSELLLLVRNAPLTTILSMCAFPVFWPLFFCSVRVVAHRGKTFEDPGVCPRYAAPKGNRWRYYGQTNSFRPPKVRCVSNMQLLILDDIFRSLTKVVLSCAFHHLQLLQRVTCTILRHRPLLYVDGDNHCQG